MFQYRLKPKLSSRRGSCRFDLATLSAILSLSLSLSFSSSVHAQSAPIDGGTPDATGTYGQWGRNCVEPCSGPLLLDGAILVQSGRCVKIFWEAYGDYEKDYTMLAAGVRSGDTIVAYESQIAISDDGKHSFPYDCKAVFKLNGNTLSFVASQSDTGQFCTANVASASTWLQTFKAIRRTRSISVSTGAHISNGWLLKEFSKLSTHCKLQNK